LDIKTWVQNTHLNLLSQVGGLWRTQNVASFQGINSMLTLWIINLRLSHSIYMELGNANVGESFDLL
jgi:hypothetical protein